MGTYLIQRNDNAMNKKATKGYYTKLSNQKKLEKYGALLDIPHCKPSASLYLDILLDEHFAVLEKKEAKKKPKQPAIKNDENEKIAGYVPCSNGTFEVLQSNFDTWSNAYPNVDIGAELNKVVAWLDSNPKKTVNGCKKFLNAWLSRAQNSVKSNSGNRVSNKTSGNLSACEAFING